MNESPSRITRIPLPVSLIREMDAVIVAGIGGFETRTEFVIDAIRERILELTVEAGDDEALDRTPAVSPVSHGDPSGRAEPVSSQDAAPASGPPPSMDETRLTPPAKGVHIATADDLSLPAEEAVFGLLNRDYPSLWVLAKLAEATQDGPVPAQEFVDETIREAWSYGQRLLELQQHAGSKLTGLFPTNRNKPQSAEARFRNFAIGNWRPEADALATKGALFVWRVVGLTGSIQEPLIGLTEPGWELLGSLSGLTVEEPHDLPLAEVFLDYLRRHAPTDHAGYAEILQAVGSHGASRSELIAHWSERWPEQSASQGATNAAGYVARAREWGLVEPRLTESRYQLTPFGIDYVRKESQ